MTLRAQVRGWLAVNWCLERSRREFREAALDAGWLVPTWTEEWFGQALSAEQAEVIGEEFDRVGAPGRADRTNLHARVIYRLGSDERRGKYLRGLLIGTVSGCLLYSEPGAGSDLAGLRTSAVRDGDQWRVNGQKVWTSAARHASYGLLAARTNREVPKHAGITMFVLPMNQLGVEVRPIVQITGDQHFNEVFLTDAVVADSDRLSAVDDGWRTLMRALGMERSVMGSRGVGSRAVDPRYVGTADDLVGLARRHGKIEDAATVLALADVYAARAAARLNARRYVAEGRGADPAMLSIGKLAMSQILHRSARVRRDIIGAGTLLDAADGAAEGTRAQAEQCPQPHLAAGTDSDDLVESARANFFTLDAYFTSIGGGTDQIQRNIIGERILGLLKEADPSAGIPFREVRQS